MTEIFEEETLRPSLRSIERIEVQKLFSEFDYVLTTSESPGNLLLLYGDNGSGKTTILECIFHLLSLANNRGHRTHIGRVAFELFSITFTDGWQIEARRNVATTGDYSLFCAEPAGSLVYLASFDAAEKKMTGDGDASYIKFLRKLNLEVYFLKADRELENDSLSSARRADQEVLAHTNHIHMWPEDMRILQRDEGQELRRAIAKVTDFIRRQSSRAANQGGASANSIYEDVLKKVVGARISGMKSLETGKDVLEFRLRELQIRSEDFAKFRLTSPLVVDGILETLETAKAEDMPLISSVLEPYLDSVTARLDALEHTQKLVSSLVEDVNTFFTNKKVRFSLASGLQIVNSRGTVLEPDVLSSGEKHLLLMFCHTVVAHGRRTIFIIDEPELSLNVKWQHSLVDRLLDLVEGSPMQFIFATHSIELLSRQLKHTARLISGLESL